jgi:ABC-type transport system involved in cytochrome c biogenesis permease component
MRASLQHLGVSIKLHYRNKMALIYGYLFPLVFLLAFWVLYRHESVPLARHVGELLTVTVLGGACFGLPTTMVSERERGVWRRYRLAPVSTGTLIGSTVVARFAILITAGLLQLALALAVGMPLPKHAAELFAAFAFVSFAFIGLGLVMAMMADNVPAVQALGQCIFLPMLIIGGIAVPLASLPDWAQHLSMFFPGRYAVDALQACVNGAGLAAVRFNLLALTIIGAGGCVAAAKMFRWDAQQRFSRRSGKGWVAIALAAWVVVGIMSEYRGRVAARAAAAARAASTPVAPQPQPQPSSPAQADRPPGAEAPRVGTIQPRLSAQEARALSAATPKAREAPPRVAANPAPARSSAAPELPHAVKSSWQEVTIDDIERDLIFDRLPSDGGIVTPIAPADEEPDSDVADHYEFIREMLPSWQPGKVADPVQRVRNLLYVAAVPDVQQAPIERFAPRAVYERLQQDIPKDQLIKILYWIALHPTEGDDSAVDQVWALRFTSGAMDVEQVRDRAAIYAVKLLGRILGKIPS